MPIFVVQTNTVNILADIARASTGRLWCPYLREIAGVREICVSYSDDEGATWVEEQITAGVTDQGTPEIAVDSLDQVHLVWNDAFGLGGGGNIHYCRRTGVGWGATEDVTNWPYVLPMEEQYAPQVAIDSLDNIHVLWDGYGWGGTPLNTQIQYRQRTAVGWQAQEAVTDIAPVGNDQGQPRIAIDSLDNIHAIWCGTGWPANPASISVQYRQRTAAGWQAQEAVTIIASHNYSDGIAIDSSDDVHVVFSGFGWAGGRSIQYIKRTAGVWGVSETVNNVSASEQRAATIALDTENTIHISWAGQGWGANILRRNIQYRKKTGVGWQAQIGITDRNKDQWYPQWLWSNYPIVGGVKTNIPISGCAGVFSGQVSYQIEYYYPSAPLWVVPTPVNTPLIINKSYALSREEL